MTKGIQAWWIVASMALLVSVPCLSDSKVVRGKASLGAVFSLTGDLSYVGKGFQQGIELALSEGWSEDFKVIFEDDRSLNRAAALSAAKELIEVDKVSVLLNMAVNTMSVLAPALNKSKTVGLVMWDSNQQISSAGDYVFGFGYATELAGEDMALFSRDRLKIKRVAVISAQDEWSEIISKAFVAKFKSLGGELVIHEEVQADNTDFKSLIGRIKQKSVDAIYAPLIASGLSSWIRQSRESGFSGYLLTADGFSENEAKQAGLSNAEGVIATQLWVTDKSYRERFQKKFAGEIDNINLAFSALGYDTINCLASLKRSIEGTGQVFSSESVRTALLTESCNGVSGHTEFRSGRLSTKRERIIIVKDGVLKPFE